MTLISAELDLDLQAAFGDLDWGSLGETSEGLELLFLGLAVEEEVSAPIWLQVLASMANGLDLESIWKGKRGLMLDGSFLLYDSVRS